MPQPKSPGLPQPLPLPAEALPWDVAERLVRSQVLEQLAPTDEAKFQQWYRGLAGRLGIAPNPDDPLHYYDYRAAYRSGATPDTTGHWPSEFKRPGHPRVVLDGIDTRSGRPVK